MNAMVSNTALDNFSFNDTRKKPHRIIASRKNRQRSLYTYSYLFTIIEISYHSLY